VDFVTVRDSSAQSISAILKHFGFPLFVKPVTAGSSVGITKVHTEEQLRPAIAEALRFDAKAMAEPAIDAREIECAVLGNETAEAFEPGEILPSHEFYSFQAVECSGMARVDFFLEKKNNRILLNEINTIPGFTNISMYPKMCEASGLVYPRLLDRLIELALDRQGKRSSLHYDL
jgi:D-alanine-D-alanine ligase